MDRSQNVRVGWSGKWRLNKPLAAGVVNAALATIRQALAGTTTVSFPSPAACQGSAVLLSPPTLDRVSLKTKQS